MKKIFSLITALSLAAGLLAVPAAAEETAGTTFIDVQASYLDLPRDTEGTIIATRYNGMDGDVLIDAQGNVLSAAYASITAVNGGAYGFFKVEDGSIPGVHDTGCIDASGNVIVPTQYAVVNVVSDRWIYGIKLTPGTEDNKDYTYTIYGSGTDTKEYYLIDTVDFYYNGQLAGTLNRSEFGDGYPTAHGAFIVVTNRAGYRVFYNSNMEQSPYQSDYSSEFDSSYKNGTTTYIHCGTGEQAFVPGFSVPLEDLDNPYIYDKAVLYDAYGNVVFNAAQNYDSIRSFSGGYAVVRMNGKEGLIDRTGREVIPVEYDSLGNYEDNYLAYGCISAEKDGKFGFLDANGNITSDFVYSKDAVKNRTSFASIQNLDGTVIVLSGLVGELPEHYAEVEFPSSYGSRAFVAKNTNGETGLVDLYGNTVLPFSSEYSYLSVNSAGTLAISKNESYSWRIFSLAASDPAAPAGESDEAPETSADSGLDFLNDGGTEAAESDTWTCSNGHEGNTGKFCPECGESRPEEALTACPECGYEFPDGVVPKFCPECGTKLTEE